MVIVIFAIFVTQVFGLDKPTCPADKPTCGQVKVDGEWLIGKFFHFPPHFFFFLFSFSLFFSFVQTLEENKVELFLVPFLVFLFYFFFFWSMFIFSFSFERAFLFFWNGLLPGRSGHARKLFSTYI